ncbi:MAG TPA: formate dehydrogenase subunit gamma [Rhizobiales bacterium]|nr:formate dehydrogenase subunit gamma [Hyphomicrobiales bacterium]
MGGTVPGMSRSSDSASEIWRAVRKGVKGTVSIPDKKAGHLVQSEGDSWRAVRNGPIATWGVIGLAGVIALLAVFFLIRGKIRVEHGMAGRTITRFTDIERIGHWLLAVSFIILAVTGLNITYGKYFLLPVLGKPAFAALAAGGKWLHSYVAFAFMAGLAMVLVLWIRENFPDKYDLIWFLKGGGMIVKGVHPPSKKFNAGQKILFWLVIWGGLGLSLTGIALLFPFQIDFPAGMEPVQQMQFATTWHAVIALVLTIVVIAHIYIGTMGMEGAFDAMGTGEVDENWAREHHSVWAKEVSKSRRGRKARAKAKAAPAE